MYDAYLVINDVLVKAEETYHGIGTAEGLVSLILPSERFSSVVNRFITCVYIRLCLLRDLFADLSVNE